MPVPRRHWRGQFLRCARLSWHMAATMPLRHLLAGLIVLASAGLAPADEITFSNGDRLSGTVLSAEGGKLKIKTTVAGEITVDMKDVKTFTTEAPIEVRTNEGRVINAPAAGSNVDGSVSLPEGDVALADVKYVNF